MEPIDTRVNTSASERNAENPGSSDTSPGLKLKQAYTCNIWYLFYGTSSKNPAITYSVEENRQHTNNHSEQTQNPSEDQAGASNSQSNTESE